MKRKKIFVLLPNLEMGGSERVAINLLSRLDHSKYERHLIVLGSDRGALRSEIPRDVVLLFLNKRRVRSAMISLVLLLRKNKPDIVFSNLSHLNLALATLRFTLPSRIKVVARESNIVSKNVKLFPFSNVYEFLYRKFYNKLDLIFCQTNEMSHDLIDNYGVSSKKIRLINNPIDLEYLKRMIDNDKVEIATKRTLVACGRLDYQKGFDVLLEALAHLPSTNFQLLIVGEGEMRASLELQVHKLGLSECVSFLGFKSNPYVYISKADAFILPSRFEGMPNIVLEVLAIGKPIIASPLPGGVLELLTKSDACFIAQNNDAVSLSRAINTFLELSNPPMQNVEIIKPYLIANVITQFEEALDTLF